MYFRQADDGPVDTESSTIQPAEDKSVPYWREDATIVCHIYSLRPHFLFSCIFYILFQLRILSARILFSSYLRTPLFYAAENGHEVVVKLLLTKDSVELDFEELDFECSIFLIVLGYSGRK